MAARSHTPAEPARILLVDDNRSGLLARRMVLEELGYATEGANDIIEAYEKCSNNHYELVVTDFMMPGGNGDEFIRKLRANGNEIPIVLISGFVDALGLTEANTGANAVIMKSANEVQHLIRAAKRLVKTPRKPVRSEKPRVRLTQKRSASA